MKYFFLLICSLSIICGGQIYAQNSRADDSLALVDLYKATNGTNWKNNTNWLTNKPLNVWFGVTLDTVYGGAYRVREIDLGANNLTGSISPNIFESTSSLNALSVCYLNNNLIEGAIPEGLLGSGCLFIDLSNNLFSGEIPTPTLAISYSSALINLGYNKLSGKIPAFFGKYFQLDHLNLSHNQLTGEIPKELGNINRGYDNYYVRQFGIDLGQNQLSGSIPKELFNNRHIAMLNLTSNKLEGAIPTNIDSASNLQFIYFGNNKISGSIPKEIGKLKLLQKLYLWGNPITGNLPKELGNCDSLSVLSISDTYLTGNIPEELGNCKNLTDIFLPRNQLTGSIPSSLGNLSKLKAFNVRSNQLTGIIPESFKNLTSLKELYVFNNQLSGGIGNIPKINFDSVWVFSNKLNFDELEYPVSAIKYLYAPQDSLGISHDTTIVEMKEFRIKTLAGTSTNNSYKWFKNGVEIPGATSNELLFSNSIKSDEGVYTYESKNSKIANLTLYSRPIRVIVSSSQGIDSEDFSNSFELLPNPSNDVITLQFSNYKLPVSSLLLFDAFGSKIAQILVSPDVYTYHYNVSSLASGVYVARTCIGGNIVSRQFVVVH